MNRFYFKNKKTLNIFIIIILCFGFLSVAKICYAGAIDVVVTTVIGWIASLFVAIAGAIMSLAIKAVIQIAQYNNFIEEQTIKEAWVIIRDLCNMFFVLILLVIAFATILKLENYNVKKLLPKLLIMAVLINFSRTICGLIIDFAQVIMLTFVNSFQDGGGHFVSILNVDKYLALAADNASWEITETKSLNLTSTVVGMITAVFFLVISAIVMIVLLAVLAMRIVMLWIYVILSPLAFLLSAFPAGAKYASQWWSEFSKQVVVGPVLAFFIWLALTTSSKINFNLGSEGQSACFGPAKIMCLNDFMNFIIAIGMLIGGLIITQQIGGMAGAAAGKGIAAIRRMPTLAGKGALGISGWGARKIKSGAVSDLFAKKEVDEEGNVSWKRRALGSSTIASALHGLELRPTKIISGIKEGLEAKKRKEETTGEAIAAESLRRGGLGGLIKGGLGASQDATEALAEGFFYSRGIQTAWRTIRAKKERKRINELEKRKDQGEELSKEEIKELGGLKAKMRTPYTFHAEQRRNTAINEAKSKIGDNDNEDDLVAMFNDAVARKDKETAAAIITTAAKMGHLNEIIQSQKATKDVKDENGNTIIRKGDNLDQGGYGLNALVSQKLIGELGMSEQEAFSRQSQASSLAKSIGHFNLSESIGVKNGLMFQRKVQGVGGQQARARGELRKVDSEKAIRNYNRLAWGDEAQYEEGGKTKRDFKLNDLGKANFVEWADKINKEIDLKRFQKNAAMNISSDKEGLRKFIKDLKRQGVTEYKDEDTGKMVEYSAVAEKLITYGETVSRAEAAVEKLSASAMGSGDVSAKKGETKSAETKKEDEANKLYKELKNAGN